MTEEMKKKRSVDIASEDVQENIPTKKKKSKFCAGILSHIPHILLV